MIYTQFGVPVNLTGKTANGSHVFVVGTEDDGWEAWRDIGHLRADGGSAEIQTSFEKAVVMEMPPDPQWKARLKDALNGS